MRTFVAIKRTSWEERTGARYSLNALPGQQLRHGMGQERASLYTHAHVPPSRSELGLRSLQARTRPKRTLSCLPVFHQHPSQPRANRSPALHRAMTSTPSTMYSTPATAPAATSAGPGGNLVSHILHSFIHLRTTVICIAPHCTRVLRSEALHPRATRHAKQSKGDEAIKKKIHQKKRCRV